MVVTIDGPAGAGKSSVARALAERLKFRFLDTGAMYRTVTLAALRQGVPWDDAEALGQVARRIQIDVSEAAVHLDGEDVTDAIRAMQVTSSSHHVADNVSVREHLVHLQRRVVRDGDFVTEGRDQGTVVFPDAECKIFLTASPEQRARRRMEDIRARGESVTLAEVLRQQNERDQRDRRRPVGGLRRADDAIEVRTDDMTIEQVVDRLEQIVRTKMP